MANLIMPMAGSESFFCSRWHTFAQVQSGVVGSGVAAQGARACNCFGLRAARPARHNSIERGPTGLQIRHLSWRACKTLQQFHSKHHTPDDRASTWCARVPQESYAQSDTSRSWARRAATIARTRRAPRVLWVIWSLLTVDPSMWSSRGTCHMSSGVRASD